MRSGNSSSCPTMRHWRPSHDRMQLNFRNSSASQSSRLRPLPTTDKLRPLQPPPQGSVALSISRLLRTGDEPTACSVWLAKLASSAPETVTTTQCGVVCSRPPPAPSSGGGKGSVCESRSRDGQPGSLAVIRWHGPQSPRRIPRSTLPYPRSR
jgi:hypothetical protein